MKPLLTRRRNDAAETQLIFRRFFASFQETRDVPNISKIPLTDDGQVDAAVARRRLFEIYAAPVESGVRFADVVDAQSGRFQQGVEVGRTAEHRLVRPMARRLGQSSASVVPARQI